MGWGGRHLRGLFGSHTKLWPPAWLFPGSKSVAETCPSHTSQGRLVSSADRNGRTPLWSLHRTSDPDPPTHGGCGGPAPLPLGPGPCAEQRWHSGGHACLSAPSLCHIPDPTPAPEPSSSVLRLCVWSSPACRVRGPTGLRQITSPQSPVQRPSGLSRPLRLCPSCREGHGEQRAPSQDPHFSVGRGHCLQSRDFVSLTTQRSAISTLPTWGPGSR